MRVALGVLGGLAWLLLTFFVTLRLTFPSEAIADRLRFEVDRRSGGATAIALADVDPWRFGVKTKQVTVLSVDGGTTSPMLTTGRARLRVSPFTMLSEPHVTGDVQFGDGQIDFTVDLVPFEKRYNTRRMSLSASEFPLSSLPPIGGNQLEGTGALDLALDLDAPDGFASASGSARVSGRSLAVMGFGDWGELLSGFELLPVLIDELDLRIEITEGKARVVRGVLTSSLGNAEVSGDVTLDAQLGRSRMKILALVEFAELEGTLKSLIGEPWADGKHHYSITGSLAHPRPNVDSERLVRRERAGPSEAHAPAGTPETIDAAKAARERRLERLRERRGEADPGGAVTPVDVPGPVDKDEVVPVEEEGPPEEEEGGPMDEVLEEEAPLEEL